MDKKVSLGKSVLAIFFILYSFLFFVIPFPKTAAACWSFVFTIVSLVVAGRVEVITFQKGENIKSKVYGLPTLRLGVIYTIVQVIFGLLVCVIGCFIIVPAWVVIAVSVIFLAFAAIGLLSTDTARDIIENQEQEIKERTRAIRYFKVSMEGITDMCSNPELKKKVSMLADEVQYSDPVSCDELKEIEEVIFDEIEELRRIIEDGNSAVAMEMTEEISRLLRERNRLCKVMK